MRTQGFFEAATPFNDGQIFIGPNLFTSPGVNYNLFIAAGTHYEYAACTSASSSYIVTGTVPLLYRTGMFATPNLNQEQFGTAALQPGPSSVSGTSGPSGVIGYPPFTSANNPIKAGGATGAIPKGIQINWADVIYSPGANPITNASLYVYTTNFVNNAAPVQTALVTSTTLPNAAQTNPYVSRVNAATPGFIVTGDSQLHLQFLFNTGATATLNFYGIVLGVSFNFN